MYQEIILVPYDFSDQAENAVKHSIELAQASKDKILLMHTVVPSGFFSKPSLSEEEKSNIKSKLDEYIATMPGKEGLEIDSVVEEGELKSVIKNIASNYEVNLIVMGSTYENNERKTDASKIINWLKYQRTRNVIPVIVASSPPIHDQYIEIVVPVDYQKQFKETLKWVMYLAKYYKCNINFIKPYYKSTEKKHLMANNMYFIKKLLDNNNIIYGVKTAKKDKSYTDEIFQFAHDIEADLIVMMADKYKEYVLENGADHDYNKEEIPVMCIKPLPKKLQQFF